ncbi:MAG TPA: hypothetical protein VD769_00455 [Gaiellaceae bacterium]|nr:hypothetical protein [Gaiellaceae bacterium]
MAPFAGVTWPEPGEWLAPDVHALRPEALAAWLAEELWRVELDDGAEEIVPGVLVAPRGRLVSRVEAWNDEVAREFARECAARARDGATGLAADFAADATAAAERATAGPTAVLAGYMAAHAAEAKEPGTFAAERRRQSLWLAERLGITAS